MVRLGTFANKVKKAVLLSRLLMNAAKRGRLRNLNDSNFQTDTLLALQYPVDPTSRYGYSQPPHEMLRAILDRNRQTYERYVRSIADFEPYFARIPLERSEASGDFVWNNRYFQGLDAAALYMLTCQLNPKQYLEIGSGHSTRFVRRAITDHQLQTKVTSLDPRPRADIDLISDKVVRTGLQDTDLRIFEQVGEGDVVFFDGSHYCFTNSDVTVFFLEILPKLPKGIFVHFHDIFLPYDYPPDWSHRFYSEQYVVAALMLGGSQFFDVMLPNHFVVRDPEFGKVLAPFWKRFAPPQAADYGSSFWIQTK